MSNTIELQSLPRTIKAPPHPTVGPYLQAATGHELTVPPVWFMRQAGRYLPEYNALRSQHSFLEMCRTPELACEVTLQPIRRFAFDAAILFSDILVPLPALGLDLRFDAGHGPRVSNPVRARAHIEALPEVNVECDLGYVLDAVTMIRGQLPSEVALIGFAGGPFTVASYMIEGGKPDPFTNVRALMNEAPEQFAQLLDTLGRMTTRYLAAQVQSGADAIQLFDTWAGTTTESEFRSFLLPVLQKIFQQLAPLNVPMTYFALNSGHLLAAIRECGATVYGIDAHTSLSAARKELGNSTLQGNLDPQVLLRGTDAIRTATRAVLEHAHGGAHIFNVGHGLTPETPIAAIHTVLDEIRGGGQ